MYIIASDTEKSQRFAKLNEEEKMLFKIAGVSEDLPSWVAANHSYPLSNAINTVEFLLPETKYELRFLLKYEFENKICYSVTKLDATTLPNQKYGMLAFLFMILFIFSLAFRYVLRLIK